MRWHLKAVDLPPLHLESPFNSCSASPGTEIDYHHVVEVVLVVVSRARMLMDGL